MDSQDDFTDHSAADTADPATTSDQSNETIDEIGGFVFNNSLKQDGSNSKHTAEQLAEREQERIVDLVHLQPTKNAELQERWGLESGSDVHQYLESKLKEYYYRGNNGYIQATDTAEEFTQNHQNIYQDVTQPGDNIEAEDETPDLQLRDLVIALVTLTQELGHLPSANEINKHGEYRHQRYREEFGDLFNAYQAAGLLPKDMAQADFYGKGTAETDKYEESESESMLMSEPTSDPGVEQEDDEEVTEPAESDEKDEGNESQRLSIDIDESEVDIDRPSFEVIADVDEADLANEVKRFADIINEPPTKELVVEYGRFPADEYQEAFGSWDAGLENAGYDPSNMPYWSGRSHTNVDILDGIRAVAAELERAPTTTETGKLVDFSPGLASLRFGSWGNALETAGLDPSERSSVEDRVSNDDENQRVDDCDNIDEGEDNDPIGNVIDNTLEDLLLSDDDDSPI